MRKLLYLIIAQICLLMSCADYEFIKSEQNNSAFAKTVSIEDLLYLKDNTSNSTFGNQLEIEATIVGIYEEFIYLMDNSKYALRVKVNSTNGYTIGDLVKIPVGGMSINNSNQSNDLIGSPEMEIVGKGIISTTSVTLIDLMSNLSFYSSKLITVNELTDITLESENSDGKYYSFQSTGIECTMFLPDSLDYDMKSELVSVTGFLRFQDGKAIINIRYTQDITEVYVEPMMIEKIMNNSTLVKTLVQNNEDEIAPGVKFAQFSYLNTDNLVTSASLFEIDMNNPNVKIEIGSPNNAAPPFSSIQNLPTMATHKNTAYENTGWRVLAAMSGDFYNSASPYTLNGPLVRNGSVLKSDFISTTDHFFGQLKNGEGFTVGGRVEFDQIKNNLEHAGGGRIILQNRNVVVVPAVREPRPAIGYTDNNKVYMFIGNGRLLSVSNGFTPEEISHIMKALGCVGAIYGNGGGATVGVLENADGQYDKFSQSHATNLSHSPSLASSWMIVTKR